MPKEGARYLFFPSAAEFYYLCRAFTLDYVLERIVTFNRGARRRLRRLAPPHPLRTLCGLPQGLCRIRIDDGFVAGRRAGRARPVPRQRHGGDAFRPMVFLRLSDHGGAADSVLPLPGAAHAADRGAARRRVRRGAARRRHAGAARIPDGGGRHPVRAAASRVRRIPHRAVLRHAYRHDVPARPRTAAARRCDRCAPSRSDRLQRRSGEHPLYRARLRGHAHSGRAAGAVRSGVVRPRSTSPG